MIAVEEEINESNIGRNESLERNISQEIKEEAAEKSIPSKEAEEEIPNANSQSDTSDHITTSRKHSQENPGIQEIEQSQPSIDQYPKSLLEQPTSEVDTKEAKPMLSPRTGKELEDKYNQTSRIWERKPLAEVLHPSGKISQRGEEREATKEEARSVKDFLQVVTEDEIPSFHEFFEHALTMAAVGTHNDDQPPFDLISQLDAMKSEISITNDAAYPDGQIAQVDSPLSVEFQSHEKQQTKGSSSAGEGPISINPKTGKEVRCSSNQTSRIWERKPLAQILQHPSPESNQLLEIKEYFFNWPSPYDY